LAHFTVNPQGQVEQALVFGDHLGSASLLTDVFGRPKVLYDYYPFGGNRMEETIGGMQVAGTNQRYTGQKLDEESGLYYYGARYYNQNVGQFTQQDPVSLKIAMLDEVKKVTGQSQQQLLTNPQVLNSYAYTANNPVKYTDPDGNMRELPYLTAYRKLVELSTRVLNNFTDYLKSERQNAVNEYAAQYDGLSDSQKSNYKDSQEYGEARVNQDDSVNVMMGMVGGSTSEVGKVLTFGKSPISNFITKNLDTSVLANKFEKHVIGRGEFGGKINFNQFKEMFNNLWKGIGNILEKVRANGDVLRYDVDKNIYSSMSKEGKIRTFFQPETKLDYWFKQQ
jgi:RHS repeat-associated protein